MKTINKLNRALEFIENNLDEEIDIAKVAKHAEISKSHLMRSFNILTDKTIGEYIRDRKLTRAAKEILTENVNIIDVALKYGYENHGAFSKAFKRYHGVSPSKVKEGFIKSIAPFKFKIEIIGDEVMEYRTVKRDSYKLVGNSIRAPRYENCSWFWEEERANGNLNKLFESATDMGVLGACYGHDVETDTLSYMICIEKNELVDPAKEVLEVPSCNWAVFYRKSDNAEEMDRVWERIFSEWFPATGYEHENAPFLERYLQWDYKNKVFEFEIWIPYKEKE